MQNKAILSILTDGQRIWLRVTKGVKTDLGGL